MLCQEEAHPHPHVAELAAQAEHSSKSTSLEVDTSSEASSGTSRRSVIGLSDKELLKCAFSHPQTDRAEESPGVIGEYSLIKSSQLCVSLLWTLIGLHSTHQIKQNWVETTRWSTSLESHDPITWKWWCPKMSWRRSRGQWKTMDATRCWDHR